MRQTRALPLAAALLIGALASSSVHAQAPQGLPEAAAAKRPAPGVPTIPDPPFPGVSLKIRDEVAPPGAMAQMKVYITEPRPIATGGARFAFDDFESIEGISVSSPQEDAHAVALFDGKTVSVSIVSPSGTFGLDPDYPVLAFVGKVPETAAPGATFAFDVAGGLEFVDPAGTIYPTESQGGLLQVGRSVAVHDVLPGSAELGPGDTVTILGSGFDAGTRVRFSELELGSVDVVDSGTIRVRMAGPTSMHGMRIKVDDRSGFKSKVQYFSYHRTRREGASAELILNAVVPVFPKASAVAAVVDVADTLGIAVQNIEAADALVSAEWLDAAGQVLSVGPAVQTTVPASRFLVRTPSEIAGDMPAGAAALRLTSTVPVQAMGVSTAFRPQLAR